jgi:hypothetical protein
MRSEIQRRIGSIEVQDQLAVLTYLRDTFKFIDRTKICAVGTGYGGYVATMMLLQDFHQVINCSVSISPITNWKYYSKLVANKYYLTMTRFQDSYFTEKYLGAPSKHLQEYDNADLTMRAGNLNERRFLLIHGDCRHVCDATTRVVVRESSRRTRSLVSATGIVPVSRAYWVFLQSLLGLPGRTSSLFEKISSPYVQRN